MIYKNYYTQYCLPEIEKLKLAFFSDLNYLQNYIKTNNNNRKKYFLNSDSALKNIIRISVYIFSNKNQFINVIKK